VKFGEHGKSSGGHSKTSAFQWGLTVLLTEGLPQVCVDSVKGSIGVVDSVFEVMTQVNLLLTNVSQFDLADSAISVNDAN
jgi:hypothetical protein